MSPVFASRIRDCSAIRPWRSRHRSNTTSSTLRDFARLATSSPTRFAATVFVAIEERTSDSIVEAAASVFPAVSSMTWASMWRAGSGIRPDAGEQSPDTFSPNARVTTDARRLTGEYRNQSCADYHDCLPAFRPCDDMTSVGVPNTLALARVGLTSLLMLAATSPTFC